jgi:predicted mannosyl-3-phosphoglycerate phosphatase (HAD superfamily)
VIFTRVEGVLCDRLDAWLTADESPLQFLNSWGVPVVLVSSGTAAELQPLLRDFGLQQPFICENGGVLYVPQTWLEPETLNVTADRDEWERFRLSPPSMAAAVELACTMFVARGYDSLLTVGIGCDLADYGLLTAVDIPIVVRSQHGNQTELLRHLPEAYVTSSPGIAGWSEAVLGSLH